MSGLFPFLTIHLRIRRMRVQNQTKLSTIEVHGVSFFEVCASSPHASLFLFIIHTRHITHHFFSFFYHHLHTADLPHVRTHTCKRSMRILTMRIYLARILEMRN